jgi:hypothetical protein
VVRTLAVDTDRLADGDVKEGGVWFIYLRAPGDLSDAAFDAIAGTQRAKVRVRVDHAYTDPRFERRPVVLDETREVIALVMTGGGPGNPGPLPSASSTPAARESCLPAHASFGEVIDPAPRDL